MRRYTITVGDRAHVIDVEEISATTFQVRVGGDGGEVIEVRLDDQHDLGRAGGSVALSAGAGPAPPPVTSPAPRPAPPPVAARPAAPPPKTRPSPPVSTEEALVMTAPMPGTILSIDVSVGEDVNRGDILLVFEAMKMKNALHASHGGRIAEILVKAGQQVRHGEALIRIDT